MKLEALRRLCRPPADDGAAQRELDCAVAELDELRERNRDYTQMLDDLNSFLTVYSEEESLDAVVAERNALKGRLVELQDELYKLLYVREPEQPVEVAEEAEKSEEHDQLADLKAAIAEAQRLGQDALRDYEEAYPEFQTVEHLEKAAEKQDSEKKREDDAPDVLVGSQSRLTAE